MTMNQQDFKEFMASADQDARAEMPRPILNDLVGSRLKLFLNYSLASVAGYLASLMICAQCSIGFTPMAWQTSALIHHIPDPWCPIVCGVIFGIFPFLFSSLWINRFQHRYLLFRMPWVPIAVPLFANIIMSLSGPEHGFVWQTLWFIAAAGTPYLAELAFRTALKQKAFPSK